MRIVNLTTLLQTAIPLWPSWTESFVFTTERLRRITMAKALVVYATRKGATKAIADLIAEGIRSAGAEADCVNVTDVKMESALEGYDGYAFGSATYHGEMIPAMKSMLFIAEKVDLGGKVGGAFGAFGWSGEAPGRIYDTMKEIFKMSMIGAPLMLASSSLPGGREKAQDYGKGVAERL
jgi:flavorubredoxin